MKEMSEELASQGLVIIGANNEAEEGRDAAIAFAKKNVPYTVLLDMNQLWTDYKVEGIPVTVIIDRKGVVRHRIVGFAESMLDGIREQILDTLKAE